MRKVDEDHFDPAIQQPVEGLEVSAGTPRTERVVLNEHVRGVGSAAGEQASAIAAIACFSGGITDISPLPRRDEPGVGRAAQAAQDATGGTGRGPPAARVLSARSRHLATATGSPPHTASRVRPSGSGILTGCAPTA